MPRKPRFFVPGIATHIVQRGNNRQPIFFENSDYRVYLAILSESRKRYPAKIHAYALMTNHVHILATPSEQQTISQLMQYVGRQYVPFINKKYSRTGTLWEGRFRASIVETSSYLLACYRYIELNPVRAGMVDHPGDYPWTSYRRNALLETDKLVAEHSEYSNLGASPVERAANYCLLFKERLSDEKLSLLRRHTQSGTPLGSARFREDIETVLCVKAGHSRRGRPKRHAVSAEKPVKGL